jgi:hypothetical protein
MWTLIKKFSVMYLVYAGLYAVLLFPLLNYDRITGPDTAAPNYILYQGSFIFWLILGGLWSHEKLERKTRGTQFLMILPIRIRDIVKAKFALVLFSALFILIFQSGAVGLLSGDADLAVQTWKFSAVVISVCLVFSGAAYTGIARFGFSRIGPWLILLWLFLFLSPILVRELLMRLFDFSMEDVIDLMTGMHWAAVLAGALLVFWAFMQLSIRVWREEA